MFKPLNKRVLVKPDKVEEETSFGLLLPDKDKEKPVSGIVVVGNKEVKKGDKILFSRFGYDEVMVDKELFYLINPDLVLGIF